MTLPRLAILSLAMAIIAAATSRIISSHIDEAVYAIDLREWEEQQDESYRVNLCIQGSGWAVFKMIDAPTPETERWRPQYLGCNVKFQ